MENKLTEERIENAIESGSDQFWKQMVAEFPEVTDGHFLIESEWTEYLRTGLIHWLHNNHPTCQLCYFKYKHFSYCTPCQFVKKEK